VLDTIKKYFQDQKIKARACERRRKLTSEQKRIEAWLAESTSLEEVERKQRELTRRGHHSFWPERL
jgi:predicted ribosome quality control (RQC) complex YloA/Tae2 family protein